jgi:drug/metabolite transporter (DMT)-like permease
VTNPTKARGFTALAAAGSLWGTGFIFGKWALDELSVGQMVFSRFGFASLGFAPAIIIGAILGVVIFADALGPFALVGGALVVGAAVYVASSENHPEDRSRERAIA